MNSHAGREKEGSTGGRGKMSCTVNPTAKALMERRQEAIALWIVVTETCAENPPCDTFESVCETTKYLLPSRIAKSSFSFYTGLIENQTLNREKQGGNHNFRIHFMFFIITFLVLI